jgi:hypothetical protein
MTDNKMKYYLTELEYVGPNPDQHLNDHEFAIATMPSRTNMSGEEKIDGWLGTTNDWASYAHGDYESMEAALAALDKLLPGGYREADIDNWNRDHGVVAQFLAGAVPALSREESINWCYPLTEEITPDTTDEGIDELVHEAADECRTSENPGEIDCGAVSKYLREWRTREGTEEQR